MECLYLFQCLAIRLRLAGLIQDRQCTYSVNSEAHAHSHFCCEKAISITYSECVSVALNHPALQSSCSLLSSVACPALLYFPHMPLMAQFSKKVTDHKMRVLNFSTNFVGNISHSNKN